MGAVVGERDVAQVRELGARIAANMARVVMGKPEAIRLVLAAVLAGGHLLIEDVPGVGKTVLAKALARSIGSSFKRIQFTPDLLPGDVTGLEIYNQQSWAFEYRPAPSWRRSCWPTRSTAPRRRRNPPCWRAWRRGR